MVRKSFEVSQSGLKKLQKLTPVIMLFVLKAFVFALA